MTHENESRLSEKSKYKVGKGFNKWTKKQHFYILLLAYHKMILIQAVAVIHCNKI